ncbi:MAG: ketoacyl-ACP synthase III [Desulfobacterota bacterium]|nr:ketoacyl-ACP synthase III [Thermodesulfobacteriota bacterium]
MKKICIKGTGCYIPERVVPNSYFETLVDTSEEWIVSRTGIRERRMVLPGQALSDMATPASKKALEMAGLTPLDLDLIIVGTSTADMASPSAGCMIQHKLGAKKAVAFDVNAACPGFIYGLAVARKFMQDGSHRYALVIGGEIISHRTDFQDRNTCVLFGDGAGAVVLGLAARDKDGELLSTEIYSDGDLWKLLHVPGGGSMNPISHEMIDQRLHYVKMKGNEVFKHAVRSMTEAAQKALISAGMTKDQVDWFIPHQANIRIMESVAKQMDIPLEKVIQTVQKYGNTSAATIPTALDEAVRSGQIKRGQVVLSASFGAGFTWGAALFRF